MVLTLQPRGLASSRTRSTTGLTGQRQGEWRTDAGTAGALSSTSASASVQEVVPLARGDGQPAAPVQWVVLRRYSEFAALRDSLQSDGLLADVDKEDSLWPKKHTLKSSKDKSVVKERLEKLPKWLVSISRLPAVSTHPTFRTFLQLEQFEAELASAAASLRPQIDHAELEISSASPMVPSQPIQATSGSPMLRSPPALPLDARGTADSTGQGRVVSKHLGGGTTVASATSTGMSSHVPSPHESSHAATQVMQRQDGRTHTTTTTTTTSATAIDPSLPLHAANEYATARTEVDLRLPKAPLPSDRSPLPHEVVRAAEQRLAEVQKEESVAARLRVEADRHRRAASELSNDVRVRTEDVAVAESEADRLQREAALAEDRARELRAAAQQQSAAVVQLREKIQQEINAATVERQKSAELVLRARELEGDAARRREAAIAAHEQATRDLLAAERRVREAVEGEEHRQVAEAAAAAARARKLGMYRASPIIALCQASLPNACRQGRWCPCQVPPISSPIPTNLPISNPMQCLKQHERRLRKRQQYKQHIWLLPRKRKPMPRSPLLSMAWPWLRRGRQRLKQRHMHTIPVHMSIHRQQHKPAQS